LQEEFTGSSASKLVELSKNFIMVNLEDNEEPEPVEYAPDGTQRIR
jgi:hypothetical protein